MCYDANIGAGEATVKTNFEDRVMQMTSGCALAVVMTNDNVAARSFVTAKKNVTEWWKFAASNTEAISSLASKAAKRWKTYQWLDDQGAIETWDFNLRGYMVRLNRMWVIVEGEVRSLDR